jgi:hypothetical protein
MGKLAILVCLTPIILYISYSRKLLNPVIFCTFLGDLSSVLKRSFNSGLEKLIITGGDLKESEKALSLCYLDGS